MTVNSLGRNSIQYYPIVVKLCLETRASQLILGAAMTGNSVVRVYLEGKTALQPKNILGDENRELNLLEAAK